MFNWQLFVSIWLTIGLMFLAAAWLTISVICMYGGFSKAFRIIWLILTIILILGSTVYLGFVG